jgi:hypothetical protein
MDSVHFEIRYSFGNLYFDRCGQCLNDIERNCDGWYVKSADPSKGILENPSKSYVANFNSEQFNFSCQQSSKIDIKTIAKDAATLWKIIEANLGLEEYMRQGARFYYLMATTSIEDAEKIIEKSALNIVLPEKLIKSGFERKNTHILTVLKKENFEYRITLTSVTRYDAMNPDNLIKADPHLLSEKQNKIRLEKFKRLSEYSSNPMYAVCLDTDCYTVRPEKISVEDFIIGQHEVVQEEFLPILSKL